MWHFCKSLFTSKPLLLIQCKALTQTRLNDLQVPTVNNSLIFRFQAEEFSEILFSLCKLTKYFWMILTFMRAIFFFITKPMAFALTYLFVKNLLRTQLVKFYRRVTHHFLFNFVWKDFLSFCFSTLKMYNEQPVKK